MEFLVRCSECKYDVVKEGGDLSVALENFYMMICKEHFKNGFDQKEFREQRYWTEEIDFVYFSNEPIISYFYDEYSEGSKQAGEGRFISIDGFKEFVAKVDVKT